MQVARVFRLLGCALKSNGGGVADSESADLVPVADGRGVEASVPGARLGEAVLLEPSGNREGLTHRSCLCRAVRLART